MTESHFIERLPLARGRPFVAYGAAVALTGVGLIIRALLNPLLPQAMPYFTTFFPVVTISAFLFGRGPGTLTAILCGAATLALVVPRIGFSPVILAIILYVVISAVNITLIHWLQVATHRLSAERARSEALAENRAVLFREMQHRISNNLQVVASLIALQKREVADGDARAALTEAARRLEVIGRIHRNLHNPEGGPPGMQLFLSQLVEDTLDATGRKDITHQVTVGESVNVKADATVPIALIIAETVANALEHGFDDHRNGHIAVDMCRLDDKALQIDVRDNGRGLPQDFELARSPSLGLRIVTMLARQLGGEFRLFRNDHTVARLTFPA